LRCKSCEWKTKLPFVPAAPLWMCPAVIDETLCYCNCKYFVVLLNLSVAMAVELFVGTSFDPINISAEKVVILGPELVYHLQDDKVAKRNNAVNKLNTFHDYFFVERIYIIVKHN
jgi:hypothetical protein